jgi:hypothetical protein
MPCQGETPHDGQRLGNPWTHDVKPCFGEQSVDSREPYYGKLLVPLSQMPLFALAGGNLPVFAFSIDIHPIDPHLYFTVVCP